jgi:hypothetical protein
MTLTAQRSAVVDEVTTLLVRFCPQTTLDDVVRILPELFTDDAFVLVACKNLRAEDVAR